MRREQASLSQLARVGMDRTHAAQSFDGSRVGPGNRCVLDGAVEALHGARLADDEPVDWRDGGGEQPEERVGQIHGEHTAYDAYGRFEHILCDELHKRLQLARVVDEP